MKSFTAWIFPRRANYYTALIGGILTGISLFTLSFIDQYPKISGNLEAILMTIVGGLLIPIVFLYVIGKEFFQSHAIQGWLSKNYFGDTGLFSFRAFIWLISTGLSNVILKHVLFF